MEVVGFRKKDNKSDAYVMFNNNLVILDEILDCKRSSVEKCGLGYNKERGKYVVGTWSHKTHEEIPSTSKNEIKSLHQETTQHKEDFIRLERC